MIYANKIERTGTGTQTKKAVSKQISVHRYRVFWAGGRIPVVVYTRKRLKNRQRSFRT